MKQPGRKGEVVTTTKTREQVFRERDDRTMILTPAYWHGVLLPIKRRDPRGGSVDCAYLSDPSFGYPPFRVFHGNISNQSINDRFTDYLTVDAVLADGWVVD